MKNFNKLKAVMEFLGIGISALLCFIIVILLGLLIYAAFCM